MAKNLKINGVTYESVPQVSIPLARRNSMIRPRMQRCGGGHQKWKDSVFRQWFGDWHDAG